MTNENTLKQEALSNDIKLKIQEMRDFDIAKELSRQHREDAPGAAREVFAISQRPDSYYLDKINNKNGK